MYLRAIIAQHMMQGADTSSLLSLNLMTQSVIHAGAYARARASANHLDGLVSSEGCE